jgi:hypothetical protein
MIHASFSVVEVESLNCGILPHGGGCINREHDRSRQPDLSAGFPGSSTSAGHPVNEHRA